MTQKKRRGNPFRGVLDIMSEMNRISDHMSPQDLGGQNQARGFADAWSPTTDILARESDLIIRCELPGVVPGDVDITFSNGYLTISGERRGDVDSVVYYASERYWGAFRREITLPAEVDEEDIDARFGEGLLEVTVRGAAESAGPKRIQIRPW